MIIRESIYACFLAGFFSACAKASNVSAPLIYKPVLRLGAFMSNQLRGPFATLNRFANTSSSNNTFFSITAGLAVAEISLHCDNTAITGVRIIMTHGRSEAMNVIFEQI